MRFGIAEAVSYHEIRQIAQPARAAAEGQDMQRRTPLLGAALLIAATGCTSARLEVTHVPNPVLLGPVDRIGGHRAAATAALQTFELDADGPIVTNTEHKQVGKTVERTRRIVGGPGSTHAFTNALLEMTEGRAERDVHVDGIPAGAFVMVAGTSVLVATWVDVGGHVVEVRRGR